MIFKSDGNTTDYKTRDRKSTIPPLKVVPSSKDAKEQAKLIAENESIGKILDEYDTEQEITDNKSLVSIDKEETLPEYSPKVNTKNKYYKTWKPEFDIILNYRLTGKTSGEIAKASGRSESYVFKVLQCPEFETRFKEAIEAQRSAIMAPWEAFEENKGKLVKEAIALALEGEEATRSTMVRWCLERFPEFATKNIQTMINNTQTTAQLSKEDAKKIEKASNKLLDVIAILKKGNPNIIDIDKIDIAVPSRLSISTQAAIDNQQEIPCKEDSILPEEEND